MKSFKYLALPTLTLLLIGSEANAQTVYRCGSSYSQTPCVNAVAVPTDDARSDDQRVAAQKGLVRDKALADAMETTRRKDEAQALARDQAANARAESAQRKLSQKKEGRKKSSKATLRTVKVQEAGVFTATDGAVAQKTRKKKASRSNTP